LFWQLENLDRFLNTGNIISITHLPNNIEKLYISSLIKVVFEKEDEQKAEIGGNNYKISMRDENV